MERVHLCRVAGNTVWSYMAGDIPLLWDGFPLKSYTHLYITCFQHGCNGFQPRLHPLPTNLALSKFLKLSSSKKNKQKFRSRPTWNVWIVLAQAWRSLQRFLSIFMSTVIVRSRSVKVTCVFRRLSLSCTSTICNSRNCFTETHRQITYYIKTNANTSITIMDTVRGSP